MTKREALAEARRRWGRFAELHCTDAVSQIIYGVFAPVETAPNQYHMRLQGRGYTWAEAFADADRRDAHGD